MVVTLQSSVLRQESGTATRQQPFARACHIHSINLLNAEHEAKQLREMAHHAKQAKCINCTTGLAL
jgi:hypothetical protein